MRTPLFAAALAIALASTGAQAQINPSCGAVTGNLVKNCSFEDQGIGSGGWRWTSGITSWTSNSGVFEQWYGESGFKSRDGRTHLELDVDANGQNSGMVMNTTIWQMLETKVGYRYNVFYSASHRANGNGVSKVGVLLDFDGNGAQGWSLGHDTGNALTKSLTWVDFGFSFVATSNQTKIGFAAMGTPNEYGDHIDNIGVTAVPEPNTAMLVASGLLGLGFLARRRRTS